MGNPWMKKNPFMSLWLSAAHRVLGSVRGHATAQAKRQVKSVIAETMSAAAPGPAPKAKPKPRRRR